MFGEVSPFNQKPVHQGSIDAEFGKLAVNLWFNRDLNDDDKNDDVTYVGTATEYDITVSYSGSFSKLVSYDTGVILYQFPETVGGDTDEFYFGVSFDTVLSPSITAYYDYLATHLYVSLGVGQEYEIWKISS